MLLFGVFATHHFLAPQRRSQLLLVCIPFDLVWPPAVDASVRTDIAANCDRGRRRRHATCSSLCLPREPLGNPRAIPRADPIKLAPEPRSMHRRYLRRSSLVALRGTHLSLVCGSARYLCYSR